MDVYHLSTIPKMNQVLTSVASLDPDYFDFDRGYDQREVKPPALYSHRTLRGRSIILP